MHHRNRWTLALAAILCVVFLAGLAACSKEGKKEGHFKKGETYLSENKFREAVIEFNHLFLVGRGIGIQPDIQYIIRPAGTGAISNALAVGVKVSVDF